MVASILLWFFFPLMVLHKGTWLPLSCHIEEHILQTFHIDFLITLTALQILETDHSVTFSLIGCDVTVALIALHRQLNT